MLCFLNFKEKIMAEVKYGREIKTKAELQNLITSLVFRKEESFKKKFSIL